MTQCYDTLRLYFNFGLHGSSLGTWGCRSFVAGLASMLVFKRSTGALQADIIYDNPQFIFKIDLQSVTLRYLIDAQHTTPAIWSVAEIKLQRQQRWTWLDSKWTIANFNMCSWIICSSCVGRCLLGITRVVAGEGLDLGSKMPGSF